MSGPTVALKYLTRKEAAEYLSKTWFRISVSCLARYAVNGIGPAFRRLGLARGSTLYTKEDLDEWAAAIPVCASRVVQKATTPIMVPASSITGQRGQAK